MAKSEFQIEHQFRGRGDLVGPIDGSHASSVALTIKREEAVAHRTQRRF
jgi:hypothetical protein